MENLWYSQTMGYYIVLIKNKSLPYAATFTNLKDNAEQKKRDTKESINTKFKTDKTNLWK